MKQHVETLIRRAAEARDSNDAVRLAQAACNAANAMTALSNLRSPDQEGLPDQTAAG